ncbi:MAG TPA: hypothetical protein VFJ82_10770 [Longimicrobium sp.]|nr:hypothetical protein [Longimicrobium sp.]
MKSKMKLDLEAVRVESCEMMAPVSIDADMPKTQPVSYPCCYSVYVN